MNQEYIKKLVTYVCVCVRPILQSLNRAYTTVTCGPIEQLMTFFIKKNKKKIIKKCSMS